ncbi:MAG TPA: flavodoxin family protein [Syntrophorhabdales bacterium]|nr:flavodoxin family protein [Syntrophorhabdales bacterium]
MSHETMLSAEPKKILGLIGSSRRLGNCEVFVKEISRYVPAESTLRLIRLPGLYIGPCRACYACIMGEPCPQNDHIGFLREQIVQSDALLIAAPVYFLGAHSIIKRILDRGFLFYEDAQRNEHKPCVLVNLYGIEEKMGVAPQTLRALAGVLCLDVKASVNLRAALPGEVVSDRRNVDLARKLGELIFSDKTAKRRTGCPYCGCEIVRLRGGQLICTLCHGSFTLDAKAKPAKGKAGWEIGTAKFVREHSAWLKGMKDRYMAKRKELLRLTLPYKGMGTWVEPPEKQ